MTLTTDAAPETPANTEPADVAVAAKARPTTWKYFVDVLTTILTIVVVTVAALAIVIAAATHFSSRGQYTVFGHPVMIVLSGSMSPVIDTGDLIVDNPLTATQANHLHVGQIASFREAPGSDTTITHRIVAVTTTADGAVAYITKGDANNAADSPPRPATDLVGVYSTKLSRGGYILNALHQPLTLALLLASPILWFIAGPLFKWGREMDDPASLEEAASASDTEADTP